MIGLSSSSYYYDPKFTREERERQDADLRGLIEQCQSEVPNSGYRPVQQYLKRRGVRVGERRIRRVMKRFSMHAKIKRAFKVTTDSNHDHRVYPNHLPGMKLTGSNQVWAADITYIRIDNGFVYLAVIADLFNRKIIGWSVSKHIDGDLTLNALRMAISRQKPSQGVIHHSDRGVQYLCGDYVTELKTNGFIISNSRKGNPYDNAFLESLMKTLKQQEVYLAKYETYLDVVDQLPQFIEDVYNEKRVHSGIGYLTPNELEEMEKSNMDVSRFELEI